MKKEAKRKERKKQRVSWFESIKSISYSLWLNITASCLEWSPNSPAVSDLIIIALLLTP